MNNPEQADMLKEQYKDATKFNARVELHRRFSVNPLSWHRWVLNQFEIPANGNILELGCGPGWLWLANYDRIPPGWQITLTDFSSGMVESASQKLKFRPFQFKQVDAQAIPFDDASFDAVIANHMLYHVPDKNRALAEIRRVLKPGGKLYASTIGQDNMLELNQLKARLNIPGGLGESIGFNLENGAAQLSSWFPRVELRLYEDELVVTEVEPIIAYMNSDTPLSEQQEAESRLLLTQEIAAKGAFHISKPSGMFVTSL